MTALCLKCVYLLCSYHIVAVLSIDVATTIPPKVVDALKDANVSKIRYVMQQLNNSRRILFGSVVRSDRPYMVYLKLPSNSPKYKEYRHWLCGGVIVHEEYILTSAACIEDAKHFYVVSGTFQHHYDEDRWNNMCIKNGAKKAIWKCVPRNYVFDGHENDNLRWMNNDIAVVRVEDEFDFTRRIKGCDFIPKPICYNNQSADLEKPGTLASVAGWGSTQKYSDWVTSRRINVGKQDLLEAPVSLISKKRCKRRWGQRYHNIIDNYMICTSDLTRDVSEICQEKYVDCRELDYYEYDTRRMDNFGGFCENDHGGPLVYGNWPNAVVIGIISACLVKQRTNECYGPFLYTSIYKNRNLINCAIYKSTESNCGNLFRSSQTYDEMVMKWIDHPDGPAKNEIAHIRRNEEQNNSTSVVANVTEVVAEENQQMINATNVA